MLPASSSPSSTPNTDVSYTSQSETVRSLHQAFVDHVYPPSRPEAHGDPSTFDRLEELRASRDKMHRIYALGEDLWAEWIQDETMLAKSVDEKVAVMEKCLKAVAEEFGSVKLWLIFGDWLHHTHRLYHELDDKAVSDIATEEALYGREFFSWQVLLENLKQGAEDCMWSINDSHLVWNRYVELLLHHLAANGSEEMTAHIKALFDVRLQTPHADWEGTSQRFSTFISAYDSADYESIMVSTIRKGAQAKSHMEARQALESELATARESGDAAAEYAAFAKYLKWERSPEKPRRPHFELTNALYQRAALRFPTQAEIWEEHVLYLVQHGQLEHVTLPMLPTLDRATRHCPWAGGLWALYLLASEREGQSFSDTEEVKHKATSTGLLEASGLEEVNKVHTAWCTYLRRRAFQPDSTDEDVDVAEMGIRSSIENLHELAAQKFGEGSNPDPMFRLERIYINFLTESGSRELAREIFRRLVPKQGDSWQFWLHFYTWEMARWAEAASLEDSEDDQPGPPATPHYATGLLRQAVDRETVDWPEKIMDMYITHCEDYAGVVEQQTALVQVKKMEQVVAKKREADAYRMAAQMQSSSQHPGAPAAAANSETSAAQIGKRKRQEAAPDHLESDFKRTKMVDGEEDSDPAAVTGPLEKASKRDRENATILVDNLPDQIGETRLRQFFRDCGTVNTLRLVRQNGTSAIVEFGEKEAALFAQSRDGKMLDGETVRVQLGSGSTLFVANFPPTADESYIRSLFEKYGEIVDIRFPSLKYNTHRRFCYVQFKLNVQAHAATALDGSAPEPGLRLVAKISNPAVKQDRSGAMEEGREVYCRNMHWNASEDDVRTLFAKYGEVESVRIPRKIGGQSKGFCFVVFSSEDDAQAATALNGHSFMSRELHVELSSRTGAKRQATTVVARATSVGAEATAPTSPPSATDPHAAPSHPHARTIALLDVPDTINNSRIRALSEPHGSLVKVVLRPDHQGAIVEYADEASAGRAALALQGYEILPGRPLAVGTVPELLRQKGEIKPTDKIQTGKIKDARRDPGDQTACPSRDARCHQVLPSRPLVPQQVAGAPRRPAAAHSAPRGAGGRRGGHLGQKRGGFGQGLGAREGSAPVSAAGSAASSAAKFAAKSNNDFRDLLSQGRSQWRPDRAADEGQK